MRVSYNWLKDYVDIDVDVHALAELITRAGVEVEGIEATDKGISGVVVAEVLTCVDHPNSDHLHLCEVTTDGHNRIQVVCGAPNVAAGQKVLFAQVGATLPGGLTIRETTLRGEASSGMICSMQELGIPEELTSPEDKDGIRVLPADAPLGENAVQYMGLDDHIIEMDLTPNRSDCLSVYNIAREVAALLKKDIRPIQTEILPGTAIQDKISVAIADPDLCHRFTATMVTGAKVGRSPIWMEHRLQCAGIRPISNLVDVTNYVMLELGQPLHAYDHTTVAGPYIHVRRAQPDEVITTLDGQDRKLSGEMLLICDADRAVGIAGVMGGENTEIRATTQDVLIESAYFEPRNIRKTSLDLGLRSEASLRNEKGLNIETVGLAGWRAATLMCVVAGAQCVAGQVDAYPTPHEPVAITMRYAKANDVLGTQIEAATMREILLSLGFVVLEENDLALTVQVPPHRPDISIPEDLVEEIARLYGYDNIPETLPYGASTPGVLTKQQRLTQHIKHTLAGLGLHEVVTYSMVSARHADMLRWTEHDPRREQIPISNPLSEEMAYMRTSNLPGLLTAAANNVNHQMHNLAFFELSKLFFNKAAVSPDNLATEVDVISLLLSGHTPEDWTGRQTAYDFYYLKGVVEALLKSLGITDYDFEALSNDPTWHPGRTARLLVQGQDIGVLGAIHPLVQQAYHLKAETFAAEIHLDRLFELGGGVHHIQALPKFPPAMRDFAFVVDDSMPASAVLDAIWQAEAKWLEQVALFDVYSGASLPANKKSLAVALRFQSDSETLSDDAVQKQADRILAHVKQTCGAELRS